MVDGAAVVGYLDQGILFVRLPGVVDVYEKPLG